jgi:hypothetical protein
VQRNSNFLTGSQLFVQEKYITVAVDALGQFHMKAFNAAY